MTFESLNIIKPILKALSEEGYTSPTPIQTQSIPILLERNDLLGCAQTGTGKTAAFAIPILQILSEYKTPKNERRRIKALIVTPTRELAIQIDDSFKSYGRYLDLRHLVVYGGVNQYRSTISLQKGVDILVATPGRLLDLMQQRYVDLRDVELFVLDEADRMLDMGFMPDIKRLLQVIPENRQSLFFCATMPPEIIKLANTILHNPIKVEIAPQSTTAETINQFVYFVDRNNKNALLLHLLENVDIKTALVFTRTKHGADKIAQLLTINGVRSESIHSNKSQNARQRALDNFKDHYTRVLVATDIAARGIDIDDLAYVINYEIPNVSETYVHRIGRTGRAGSNGTAFSFCDNEEKTYLKAIQKLIAKTIPVVAEHPFPMGSKGMGGNKSEGGNSDGNNNRPREFSRPKPSRNSNGRSRTRRWGS